MATALSIVALVALILTLGSTLYTIWFQLTPKNDLLNLIEKLFSWQVISAGLVVGGAKTFSQEIKGLLGRIAK